MFTGLIENVGRIVAVTRRPDGIQLRVATSMADEIGLGDSVSVNGVCLTATSAEGGEFTADIGPETQRVTTLGGLTEGRVVNLERSMRADSRFGGHFVQGHVDGMGTIVSVRPDGDAHWLTISFPGELSPFLIRKGSIAVDGISLTVATLGDTSFDIMIIPFTWEHTNAASMRPGDRVNLECDMLGKYVARIAELAVTNRDS